MDLTLETLENELGDTLAYNTATFSGVKVRALLAFVAPIKSPRAARLRRVREVAARDEIILINYEVKLLLIFLREMKRRRSMQKK
jgi:hypothetical protein